MGRGFAAGAHRFEVPDAALRAIRDKPALAIWGDADRTLGAEHFLPLFTALFPSAPVERLAGVGHYCFEDAPDVIATRVAEFIRHRLSAFRSRRHDARLRNTAAAFATAHAPLHVTG